MTRLRHLLPIVLAMVLFTSCDAIRHFLSTDLEEEDYKVGELYVDEYVREDPYVPVVKPQESVMGVTALGLPLGEGTQVELHDAIAAWIGTPYLYGGTTKAGVDCSGFVGNIYQQVYFRRLNRVANDIFQKDCEALSRSELREGDLVFFTNSKGNISHVGIYLADGIFAHSSTSRGVIISQLSDSYWSKHYYKGGRVRN